MPLKILTDAAASAEPSVWENIQSWCNENLGLVFCGVVLVGLIFAGYKAYKANQKKRR